MVNTPTIWKARYQLNHTDTGNQTDPDIVDIGMGRYVAVWTESSGGPIGTANGTDLVGQIFDAEGHRVGSEFQVNFNYKIDNESNAALATRPDGGFVMVYEDTDASGTSIRAETYDVNGVRLSSGVTYSIAGDPGADTLSNPAIAMRRTAATWSPITVSTRATAPPTSSAAPSVPLVSCPAKSPSSTRLTPPAIRTWRRFPMATTSWFSRTPILPRRQRL